MAKEILYSPDASSEEHLSKIWLPELEEHFVAALTSTLSAGETISCSRTQRLSHVNRAREFISENYDAPLGLESLASACGVCSRTLEYAFRDILNVTPVNYVKSLRLRTARLRLQEDQGHRGDVARVARQCGFSHMGHFAADYKGLFGEHPSDTLWNRTKSGSSIE